MTLRDVFQAISAQPALLFMLLSAIPTGAFLTNKWSGETAEQIWKWRYVYAVLVYLACIPGIFAVTLNIYLFLFERQSVWDMNLVVQVFPILTMIATLTLIRRKIPFDYVPGFGKLSGFMTLIAALIGVLWLIDRTRIYAVSYIPFVYLLIGFVTLLVLIRFAWSRLF
ncbi:hypothetical protein [Spirosoma montaniterrae]|uniref:Uncharacterized protein n=1 Tax=Spirosoma montaniterrae TaxID=1178516 RepID=A0A1P9WVX3_9BACT|nr:hypothetical protein [Spirosoma montaniterrae]AQG79529.1 hypothetical protein AWR27_09470 [Spirosoma montaniterrae]